jgi:hypothetical protein
VKHTAVDRFTPAALENGEVRVLGKLTLGGRALLVVEDPIFSQVSLLTVAVDPSGHVVRVIGATSMRPFELDLLADALREARRKVSPQPQRPARAEPQRRQVLK